MRETSSEAIVSYFDDLLSEAPPPGDSAPARHEPQRAAEVMEEPAPTAVDDALQELEQAKKNRLQALLNSQLLNVAEPVPAPVATAAEPFVPEPVQVLAADTAELDIHRSQGNIRPEFLAWADNGRPMWAQKPFDVLLFRVAGLTLAVPLIALGHIHRRSADLAPVFGQAEWFMGLQPSAWGSIRTVDTALLVMPERYDPKFAATAKFIVTIDGLDWGLAVDSVDTLERVAPEDVTWRSQRSKRPWLAGTVKSRMCALIDIPQMGQLLQGQDRRRRPQ